MWNSAGKDITNPFEDSECRKSEGFILDHWINLSDCGAEIWNKPALETWCLTFIVEEIRWVVGGDTDMIHALSTGKETFQILSMHW